MSDKNKPELGDEVKCKVTGVQGIAVAHARHLTGCDRIHIQPPIDKDGKHVDGWWVDVHSLDVVKKQKVKINQPEEYKTRGGFMSRRL